MTEEEGVVEDGAMRAFVDLSIALVSVAKGDAWGAGRGGGRKKTVQGFNEPPQDGVGGRKKGLRGWEERERALAGGKGELAGSIGNQ